MHTRYLNRKIYMQFSNLTHTRTRSPLSLCFPRTPAVAKALAGEAALRSSL
jgi:hypothetical protein